MKFKSILICGILFALTSCKVYEVKHYKGAELEKLKGKRKYNIYLFAQKNTFRVVDPTFSKDGSFNGDLERVTDHEEAAEIRNPDTKRIMKKHKKDLDLFTKTTISDSAVNVTLRKGDIHEYSRIESHSVVNWDKVGKVAANVFGIAACVAILSGLIYWFTFI